MEKDILTTAEAARLLGVSVRTTQLLIESGRIPSWKTLGGHRRVYRADVMAYMTQQSRSSEFVSALAILLVSPGRQPLFDALLGGVAECQVEPCHDAYFAAFAIGARLPAAVIVDLHDHRKERLAFLNQLASHAELGTTRFIRVDDRAGAKETSRVLSTTPEDLPQVLRSVFTSSNPAENVAALGERPLPFPVAANEPQRLAALEASGLLSTAADPAFDRLTWLASQHLHMPVSLMTLLTATHQHFKSRVGLDITETPRSWAMCNHTILQRQVYAVPDLSRSPLFATNPAVAGAPHFRFYAGAPVFDPNGFALGSICVMDYQPHQLEPAQNQALLALAQIASDEIRLRLARRPVAMARGRG
jgi:excisionase family DNA binding protein